MEYGKVFNSFQELYNAYHKNENKREDGDCDENKPRKEKDETKEK